MTIPVDLNSIADHLKTMQLDMLSQPETSQIYTVMKVGARDYPLFIKIYDGSELIQILTFIPCTTSGATVNDTARLLHLLNKEIDLPGFGMDESSSVVFFRVMLPALDKNLSVPLLEMHIKAVRAICETYGPVVTAMTSGMTTYKELQERFSQLQQEGEG